MGTRDCMPMARSALLFAMIIGLAAAATENAEAGELVYLGADPQIKMVNLDTGSVQMVNLDKIEYRINGEEKQDAKEEKKDEKKDAMSQMMALKEEISAVEKKTEQFQKSHKEVLKDRGFVGEVATLEMKLDLIAQTAAGLAPRLDPAKPPTAPPTVPPTQPPKWFDKSDILDREGLMARLTKLINENANDEALQNAKWKRC